MSQFFPVYPLRQRHVKLFKPGSSLHMARSGHVSFLQSDFSSWQLIPLKPFLHWQRYPCGRSIHEPPLEHGWEAHSSMSISQRFPENPAGQKHWTPWPSGTQRPPCKHELSAHTIDWHSSRPAAPPVPLVRVFVGHSVHMVWPLIAW